MIIGLKRIVRGPDGLASGREKKACRCKWVEGI
jgi:hypothetical protein